MQPQGVISDINVVFIKIWAFIKGWKIIILKPFIDCPVVEGQVFVHSFGEFPSQINKINEAVARLPPKTEDELWNKS